MQQNNPGMGSACHRQGRDMIRDARQKVKYVPGKDCKKPASKNHNRDRNGVSTNSSEILERT